MMNENNRNLAEDRDPFKNEPPNWGRKFSQAGRGIKIAVFEERSFITHFVVTAAVIVGAIALRISRLDWCIVVLSIMAALGTEMLNTSIEKLSKAVTREYNADVRDALDVASGAVSVISFGAIVLGFLVLGSEVVRQFILKV